MNPIPPSPPTLEEFRDALRALEDASGQMATAEHKISTLRGHLLEFARWEMVRASKAYEESANAQSDYEMKRAATRLLAMWRIWDAPRETSAEELRELVDGFYQVK